MATKRPSTKASTKKTRGKGSIRAVQLQKVAEMDLPAAQLKRATPRVRELTVHDLNELALSFSGVEVQNARLKALKIEDLQSLEDVFITFKEDNLSRLGNLNTFGEISNQLAIDIDVSCCCCTPCCCCAAADVDPFVE